MTHVIKWLDAPESHDYPAALSYLSLLFDEGHAESLVDMLRAAPMSSFKAKDVFRASGLPLLDASNRHVKHNLKKIALNESMSPILLVRGDQLIVGDGYHRLCAIYLLDEDAEIPSKIA